MTTSITLSNSLIHRKTCGLCGAMFFPQVRPLLRIIPSFRSHLTLKSKIENL